MAKHYQQLPQIAFAILLAVSLKPRHGYEIMKQIESDSDGKLKIGPGALYTSIKQLRDQALIEELDNPSDTRRRYYALTEKGKQQLGNEIRYYDVTVKLAQQRNVFTAEVYYA